MIKASLDLTRYRKKLQDVSDAVNRAVGLALGAGFVAVIEATPQDTGFLRASWHIDIGTAGPFHPDPPDYELKREIDNRRLWKTGPSGLEPAFVQSYSAAIDWSMGADYGARTRGGASRIVAISQVVYRNNAPYAEVVDAGTDFSAVALAAAEVAIHDMASRWRLQLRRR